MAEHRFKYQVDKIKEFMKEEMGIDCSGNNLLHCDKSIYAQAVNENISIEATSLETFYIKGRDQNEKLTSYFLSLENFGFVLSSDKSLKNIVADLSEKWFKFNLDLNPVLFSKTFKDTEKVRQNLISNNHRRYTDLLEYEITKLRENNKNTTELENCLNSAKERKQKSDDIYSNRLNRISKKLNEINNSTSAMGRQ